MTDPTEEIRARQRARSRVMALVLAGMALLFFFLTFAKIGQPGV
jgi:hypothetical protein